MLQSIEQRQALFATKDIIAGRLSRNFRIAPYSQNIILNLKRQSNVVPKPVQAFGLERIGSPKERAYCYRSSDQGGGLPFNHT